jgi:hypothetical protein
MPIRRKTPPRFIPEDLIEFDGMRLSGFAPGGEPPSLKFRVVCGNDAGGSFQKTSVQFYTLTGPELDDFLQADPTLWRDVRRALFGWLQKKGIEAGTIEGEE